MMRRPRPPSATPSFFSREAVELCDEFYASTKEAFDVEDLLEELEVVKVPPTPVKPVMMKMQKAGAGSPGQLPFVVVHLFLSRPALVARCRRKVLEPTELSHIWRADRDAFFHCDSRVAEIEVRTFSRSGSRSAVLVYPDEEEEEELDSGVHSGQSSRKTSSSALHDIFKDRYARFS